MPTPREEFLAALNHEETEITPWSISFLEEPLERMNRHFGGPQWQERIPKYKAGWSLNIPRIPIAEGSAFHRDEFGRIWQKGSIWHIHESPLKEPSLKGYQWPDLTAPERYATLDEFTRQNPDSYRIAYTGISLFEEYWKLRGWEGLEDLAGEPAFAEELLDRLTETNLKIIERLVRADVDCIGICDDQSDQRGVTIGPRRWRQMLKPRFRRIFDRIHAGGKRTFLHCCGNCLEIIPDLIEIGLDYLNPLQPECMDIFALKRRYGRRLMLEGGIGTQQLLPFGTPDDVRAAVRKCRLELGKGGGYFLEPSKAVRPETPTANMLALFDAMSNQTPRSRL